MEKAKKEGGGAGSGAVGPAAARTAVGAEHLRLEELLREIEGALSRDEADTGFPTLAEELANAMLAHFEREESLYYPTLWALRPEVEAPLKALIGIHPDFRTRLDALVETVGRGEIERASRLVEEFSVLFGEHEHAEERILASLQLEGARAQPES